MIFAQEKVHVVELHRVGAIFGDEVLENRRSALRRFHIFVASIRRMNAAETAIERAADARMMNGRSLAKKRWPQIFLHRANDGTATRENCPGPFIGRSPLLR